LAGGVGYGSINEAARVHHAAWRSLLQRADLLRGVKVLALRATRPEALHEDMK